MEVRIPGSRAAVLLVGAGERVSVTVAPNISPAFRAALDGTRLTDSVLSRTVLRVAEHALRPWSKAARAENISTIWFAPFRGLRGEVLGVFALYFADDRVPDEHEVDILIEAGNLAAVAVQQDAASRELARLTRVDAVTGLATRPVLLERLRAARSRARESRLGLAVILVDIDEATMANATLGLGSGEQLMVRVAQRVVLTAGPSRTIARMRGEEFAVLLEDLRDPREVGELAARLHATLSEPFVLDGVEVVAGVSIGEATVLADEVEAADPLRLASVGLADFRSRRGHPSGIRQPTFGDPVELSDLSGLGPELERSLAANELSLVYQPIVELPDPAPVRYEALLRWTSARRGSVSPSAFIPAAERAGLGPKLGRFVLNEAIAKLSALRASRPGVGMAINISAHDLGDDSLPDVVAALLERHRVPPDSVTFEVTEGTLMRGGGVGWRSLTALAALGIHTALDDFGTGFSQLSYLLQFEFDELKIDRSFVSRALVDRPARLIVANVIRMARDLDLDVVAEGIETPAQRDLLMSLGAKYGQGYLFGVPHALSP